MTSKRYLDNGISLINLSKEQESIKNRINKKIKENRYKFKNYRCLICNLNKFEVLSLKDRHGLRMPVRICKNCGLIQNNPRMDSKSCIKFYQEEYRNFYSKNGASMKAFFKHQQKHGKKIYDFISKKLNKKIEGWTILEIGAGSGGILHHFKNKNNNVFGTDLNDKYLNYGKRRGINLINTSLDKLDSLKIKPDLIILSHVLEHFQNPKKELSRIRKIMNQNTLLYVEVPGVKNLHRSYQMDFLRYLQFGHIFHFTRQTLENLLQKNGLSRIVIDEEVKSIFKMNKKNKKELTIKSDYSQIIDYFNNLEKKRKQRFNLYLIKVDFYKTIISTLKRIGLFNIINKHVYISSSLSN